MNRTSLSTIRVTVALCISVSFLGGAKYALAQSSTTVTVLGTAEPWSFVNGGLNTNYQWGANDGTAPAVVSATNGLSFVTGPTLTNQYVSGYTNRYPASGMQPVDANGAAALAVNATVDMSVKCFAGKYVSSSQFPAYFGELFGVFTDNSGAIVGTPFVIGDFFSIAVPSGATKLTLDVNDDYYKDNTGLWSTRSPLPLPPPRRNLPA